MLPFILGCCFNIQLLECGTHRNIVASCSFGSQFGSSPSCSACSHVIHAGVTRLWAHPEIQSYILYIYFVIFPLLMQVMLFIVLICIYSFVFICEDSEFVFLPAALQTSVPYTFVS